MYRIRTELAIMLGIVCLVAGCQQDNALTASLDRSYQDKIQDLVTKRIDEVLEARSAQARWDQFRSGDFQTSDDLSADPVRLKIERRRMEQAEALLKSGPLRLLDCLAHSLEFNDRILASRAIVQAVGGVELIAQARFLPKLAVDLYGGSVAKSLGRDVAAGLRAVQTLLEVGKDDPVDIALRGIQRKALFGYERTVAEVLSSVRLRFLKILLKRRQLEERGKLREEFTARYERMRKLEEARQVLEVDVLTAKLNVLTEDARINGLEKELVRLKLDLMQLIGLPIGDVRFAVAGEQDRFDLPLQDSAQIAYRRSTGIAQARAEVFEQDRIVRQIVWEYFPSLQFQGGYRRDFVSVGATVSDTNRTYKAGPFAEHNIDRWGRNRFASDPSWIRTADIDWYWGIELSLPIFSGLERTGRFRRERAVLEQKRHLLCNAVSMTELEVRKAYETVRENVRIVEILVETVRISKERLRVQERLKDLGRISDNELETFRQRFFDDQDTLFAGQEQLIEAQERLRLAMRYFEPAPAKPEKKELADAHP